MKTNCLIIDDEPLARKLIRNHIEKIENMVIVAECENAIKATEVLRNHHIDLMFTDIQMPEISGIEFLRTLEKMPSVIITTAHRKFALEGYELNVVDYLLKPVSFSRFVKALNKYFRLNSSLQNPNEIQVAHYSHTDYIYVRENKRYVKIPLKDILYVEGLGEYIQIYTTIRKVITKLSFGELAEQLPQTDFIRIHKSFIISVHKVDAFTSHSVEIGNKTLAIGRRYKTEVLEVLKGHHQFTSQNLSVGFG